MGNLQLVLALPQGKSGIRPRGSILGGDRPGGQRPQDQENGPGRGPTAHFQGCLGRRLGERIGLPQEDQGGPVDPLAPCDSARMFLRELRGRSAWNCSAKRNFEAVPLKFRTFLNSAAPAPQIFTEVSRTPY